MLADLDVADNVGIGRRATRRSPLDMPGRRRRDAHEMVGRLRIKTPSLHQTVRLCPGGNQQKTLLGRWLSVGVRALVLDGPTEGIDIGSRLEIYELLRDLAERAWRWSSSPPTSRRCDWWRTGLSCSGAARWRASWGGGEITEERLYTLSTAPRARGRRRHERVDRSPARETRAERQRSRRAACASACATPRTCWTYVPLLAAIIGLSVYASANSDLYLTSDNIEVLLNSVAVLGLITVGMTLIMVAGQLDLSVGAFATPRQRDRREADLERQQHRRRHPRDAPAADG